MSNKKFSVHKAYSKGTKPGVKVIPVRCKHKLVLPAYGRVSSEGMLILADFKCAKCGCKLRISFRKVK